MLHFSIVVDIVMIIGVIVVAYGAFIGLFAPVYSTGRQGDDERDANDVVGYCAAIFGCIIIGIAFAIQHGLDTQNYTSAAHRAAHQWEHQTGNIVTQMDARAKTFDYVPSGGGELCSGGTLKHIGRSYQLVPQTAVCRSG